MHTRRFLLAVASFLRVSATAAMALAAAKAFTVNDPARLTRLCDPRALANGHYVAFV